MPLQIGTRLGPYEIVGMIGVGGFGAVYRARDTRLDRDVAIKSLFAQFTGDPERIARFEREAKVLASLSHPHIAAIHGLEQTADAKYLVLELIDGESLANRLRRGALPIDETLAFARQICDALDAAHEKGIIHRDLKPANIMLTRDGQVKVLDFGLARVAEPDAPSDQAVSATRTARSTQIGTILGTAAYMSPEQARGTAVDKRADLWAFGVVLWEMLTGTRLFEGATVSDTLASVLKSEPDWSALAPTTPAAIRRLLRRCLQKDRKQRLADAADARLDIDEALTAPAAGDDATPLPLPPPPGPRWGRLGALAVAGVVIVAMAAPTMQHLRETPPPETRSDIVTPRSDHPEMFALSPDGRQIVFVASGDGSSRLWVRSLATTVARPLAGTEGAAFPFWKPDSTAIGFFAGGALKRLDLNLNDSAPQTLAPAFNGRGGTWNANDVIVFAPASISGLMRVSANAGEGAATPLTTLGPHQIAHVMPQFLADGRRFVFRVSGTADVTGIYLGALDEKSPPTRLTGVPLAAVQLQYLPAGWLLWIRQEGTLVAQRLDLAKAALVGAPFTIADGVTAVSVATTGLVAYRTGGLECQLTWFDRSGTPQGTVGVPDSSTLRVSPRVAPDGHRVVVNRIAQGNWDLWLLDSGQSAPVRSDPVDRREGVWSPDGKWILFRSFRTGAGDLYRMLATGMGEEERIVGSDQAMTPTSWSNNGFLLYYNIDPHTNSDLWVVPMSGDHRTPSPMLRTPAGEAYGEFSPDGQWVAYHSDQSGHMEIHVRPFVPPGQATAAAGERPIQVSSAGGLYPVWRPGDGKELYYLNPAGEIMAVPITISGSTLKAGLPMRLFLTHIYGGAVDARQGRQYDVAPDGRFLINTVLDSAPAPITLLQNWDPAAKK
jgi:serine/threonine protein kinase/Tol biopolymer transport system component